jgi:Neurotransmitter-gated ion-channel ligand binding domain
MSLRNRPIEEIIKEIPMFFRIETAGARNRVYPRISRKIAARAALFAAAWLVVSMLHGGMAAADEAVTKAANEAAERAATKAAEKTAEKMQESAEKAATKAVEKATTKAVEKATTKAVEKAIQKAAEKDAEKAELTGVRPDEQKGPTEIGFFVFLVDVDGVSDADQNFIANVFLRLQWRDERLADPGRPLRQMRLDEVWNPQVLITNQQGLLARSLPEVVQVESDGTVSYRQRFNGTLSQPLNLSEFPMDRQQFRIQFVSVAKDGDRLKFVPMAALRDPSARGGSIASKFSLPDWKILKHEVMVSSYEPVEGVSVPGFALQFDAERYIEYYIWQAIVPMAVVVIMSWAAFWVALSDASVRIGVATSSILTLVALRFVVANLLPRLPYMTRIDYFTVSSTVLVFLAFLVVVFTSFLVVIERARAARAIDIVSRGIFPVAFFILLIWFFAA